MTEDYWYMMPRKAEYLSTRVITPENRDLHQFMTRVIKAPDMETEDEKNNSDKSSK